MLNRTRSFSSSSSCISIEDSASRRRSASDSVVKAGVGDNFSQEEDLESCTNGDDYKFDNSSNKNSSPGIEVRALVPADSSSKTEPQKRVPNNDHGMDPKRIKRLLANRVSARRSRLRKLESMEKLQREIAKEEAKLSLLIPQATHCETRCKLLEIKNCEMKEKVEAMEKEKDSKEAEYQALLKEREALGLVYKLLLQGK